MKRLLLYETNTEAIVTFTRAGMRLRLPARHTEHALDGRGFQLLEAFSSADRERKLSALIAEHSLKDVAAQTRRLVGLGLLRKAADQDEPWSERWADFGTETWAMHLESRDGSPADDSDPDAGVSRVPPSKLKCTCRKRSGSVVLPPSLKIAMKSLTGVFVSRRTCRHFLDEPVSLEQLATVLFHASGAILDPTTQALGRTANSPGACQGTELYFCARKVAGMPRGIYHYCVQHHRANRIANLDAAFVLQAMTFQRYFTMQSVTFFFTYALDRVVRSDKNARYYRLMHYEVAHHCQNLVLAGTALGLGVFQTGALPDSVIEKRLCIDGSTECLMYAAGIGVEDVRAIDMPQVQRAKLPGGLRPKRVKRFKERSA
jgi:SagB-type dehydrogenase family enzyme